MAVDSRYAAMDVKGSPTKELWKSYPITAPELKRERYDRLHEMMETHNLKALVVLARGVLGAKGAVRYVANYAPPNRHAGAVLTCDGESVLFVPVPVQVAWADKIAWVDEIRLSSDFAADIGSLLRSHGYQSRNIGLAGGDVIPGFTQGLALTLGSSDLVCLDDALSELRQSKTESDLVLARFSASLAEQALERTARAIADGSTEGEIFAECESCLRRLGAEDWWLLLDAVGRQVTPFPSQRTVAPGDVVQFSVEPVSPGGHWTQSVRMFSRGRPSELTLRVHGTLSEALARAEDALMPGRMVSEVAREIAGALSSISSASNIPYGHGIGLDFFEPPVVSSVDETLLEANMLIVVHPMLVVDGHSFYVGDTYLVSRMGAERLCQYPLELTVV